MSRRARAARCVRVVLRAGALRRLLRWRGMRSERYDLVADDEYDTRLPLHPDQAFQYGITFHAKYIGTMDVPRPTSRVEIVSAMRRVRHEFKAKGTKKRKVTVDVSLEGVRVTARASNGAGQRKRSRFFSRNKKAAERVEIMHHPIYRIFYVSHDSADLKIFSYIARDSATDVFKCSVFKSTNKSQAMKIVRTVGQAFEVCHKMAGNDADNPEPSTSSAPDEQVADERPGEEAAPTEPASECGASTSRAAPEPRAAPQRAPHPDPLPPPPRKEGKREPQLPKPVPSISLPELPECVIKVEVSGAADGDAATPLSAQHQLQLLRERLEQQAQQTRAAVAQLLLVRDQLAAEQAARCEAQARTHQLLIHNKELLEHIAALVAHLQEKEEKGNSQPISAQQLTLLPQVRAQSADSISVCNGNCRPLHGDALLELIAPGNKTNPNLENNNSRLSSCCLNADAVENDGRASPRFGNMTNDQIQQYLISKFQDISFSDGADAQPSGKFNKHFYQNRKAFPHIPPLTSHYSNSELASLLDRPPDKSSSSDELGALAHPMSVGHSRTSLNSSSQPSTSKDSSADSSSSDEAPPFIMPLSHNGTLAATGEDGRVRLIVPVSPSPSAAGLAAPASAPATLAVPTPATLAPAAPIVRSTSEKVPNRSELMAALRAQWARHTTK